MLPITDIVNTWIFKIKEYIVKFSSFFSITFYNFSITYASLFSQFRLIFPFALCIYIYIFNEKLYE